MSFLLDSKQLNIAEFDKNNDSIAVVVKSFTLHKLSEGLFDRFAEPYIVSLAVDENGAANPAIEFSILPFPNVRKGDKISFDGQGHLIYGPKNPGKFLAYSILFMENDADIRDFGEMLERIITSKAIDISAKALLAAVPTAGTAINVLQQLTELIANELKSNKDDYLFRREGTLFRDTLPPFDLLRTYTGGNDFVSSDVTILPLIATNHLGQQTNSILL
jgi:hypothetical protein